MFQQAGLATLLVDLITPEEKGGDERHVLEKRFNMHTLAPRVAHVTHWIRHAPAMREFKIGYFGVSTGAGAALIAAAEAGDAIGAVVSHGGRPDLAGAILERVRTPTLFIVGEDDAELHFFNRHALGILGAREKDLLVIPGASYLSEEPEKLDEVGRAATDWFLTHLVHKRTSPSAT
jgi:dienelactone hydrolase